MTQEQIKAMQLKVGSSPDGFWGSRSIAACQRYLRSRMPTPHPFPEDTIPAITRFFGRRGSYPSESPLFYPPTQRIVLPFPVFFEGREVSSLFPHRLVAASLLRVFERLAEAYPTEQAKRDAGILTYDGLYAPRPIRGADSPSRHSWAIAIDLDAARNGNHVSWPTRAVMPLEVMECFAREGWKAAGAFWGRDAMHFQSTQ